MRQIRFHELENGAVQRFPPGTIINFGMDLAIFTQVGISDSVILLIKQGIIGALRKINVANLGITFAYESYSRANVFNIRYDKDFRDIVEAFFPGDSHQDWALRISPVTISYLNSIENIFSHELIHILGMRHWNAGFDEREVQLASLCWPGT